MNGWVVGVATVLVLVIAFRAWFRWFSRRPLSTVDRFAGVVDTSVDSVGTGEAPGPVHPPTVPAPGTPTVAPSHTPTVAPSHTSTAPTTVPSPPPPPPPPTRPARSVLPQQRTAATAADAQPVEGRRVPPTPQQQH